MSYEKYFIDVSGYEKIDIYRYLELLPGERGHAIEHALKKLALCGIRTGGKSLVKDITEARDTLNRWLEMREEDNRIAQTKAEQRASQGEWPTEERIENIGRNGNDGAIYESQCWCEKCNIRTIKIQDGSEKALEILSKMPICPQCGDKRCERAKHHDNECSAKKQYRDLEKPWEWQLGDYATMEWKNNVIAGKIIKISENSYGELCFTVDSDDRPYVYSYATSVEARS